MIITNCTRCGVTLAIFYGVILSVSGISHRVTFVEYVSVARDNCRTVSHEICSGWWWRKTCHTEEKQVCDGHIYVQETRHGIRCQYGWRDKDPGDCSVPICSYCGPGTQCTAPRNCTDIDECVAGTHSCSDVCINTIGSYKCACSTGYRLKSDRRTCEDVDECVAGTHSCSDVCNNTIGSYKCACSTGYRLTSDRRTCEDIDECVAGTHSCSDVCNNTIGSYECACSTGYRLTTDRRTCEVILVVHPVTAIDECETETHNCSDVCINTNGSYECGCHTSYTLKFDRRTCEALNMTNPMLEVIGNGPQTAAVCACSFLLLAVIVLIILVQRRKKIAKQNCTIEEVEMSKDEDVYQNEVPSVEEAIYNSLDMSDVDGGNNALYEPMRKITTYLRK